MTASRLIALVLAIATAALAQNFTTTCANNTCILTVTSGTVTVGSPPAAPPTVTGFNPASGPTSGGTGVTITGTNFTGATRVAIAGTSAANYTVTSATQIVAITAAGIGTGVVAVTTPAGSGSSTGSFTYTTPPPVPGQPVSDDFNEPTLNTSLWSFVNPVGDGTQSMTGTQLKLTAPAGKNHDPAFGGANNSVRVRQTVGNQDFSVLQRFDSIPTAQYQFEGIIIEQDGANYIRMQFGSTGSILVCNMDIVSGGVETAGPGVTITPSGGSLWMGATKALNVWTLYYSLDGVRYTAVGSMTQAMNMSAIGPFVGNYNATSAPSFVSLVNSFTNAPIPTSPVACNSIISPGANIQNGVNAAAKGSTACFADGLFPVAASTTFPAGVNYAKASGTPIIRGTGGYPILKVQGNDTDISGLKLEGGGIEITGSAARLNIHGMTIGEILSSAGGAAGAAIYQDAINGAQIIDSKFEDNILRNIYGPGELTCNGVFPPVGQPCDYDHNGIIIFNQANLSVQRNLMQTISGDAFHAFEAISCGETGGPKVPQPGLTVSHNTILDNHRIPIEIQLCGMSAGHTDANSISGTYVPNAWDIVISLASECTGCTVSGNYIDGAKSQGPGWNIIGTPFEVGGTSTVTDGNFVTSSLASSGNAYLGHLALVMGSAAVFSNNRMCGPAFGQTPIIIFEPPCTTGASCSPWSATNNTIAASCAGFPPPPAIP